MAYAFNGSAKLITISALTVVSVRDIYSRWVDWIATGDNSKFLPAFDVVGGQVIDAGSGTSIPIYAFLLNGWKIRPQESSHTLSVNDGVLLVDGGGDPFVNPVGNFAVRINYQQPVQAITVATGGGAGVDPALVAKIEDIHRLLGLDAAAPVTHTPTGVTAGSIVQTLTGDGVASTTIQRQ